MAEEQEESTGKSFKNIIIGLVSTVTLAVGGFITNKLTGGGDKEAPATQQAAPSIIINNSQQQQQAAGGKTVIIKEKAAEPAKPVKKKDGDEFKEKPAAW
jgi:hypothetical protein